MDIDRLEEKLDRVVESVGNIDKTLAGQAVQLADHIRRTELLESDMKPVKQHVEQLRGMGVLLQRAAAAIGIIITIAEAIHTFWS